MGRQGQPAGPRPLPAVRNRRRRWPWYRDPARAPIGIRFAGNGPGYGPGYGHGDDDLATGSIIFVPILGNTCRKKLIDNATWQIRDNGLLDCRTALARGAHGNQLGWSTSRVDVIRNGFYSR